MKDVDAMLAETLERQTKSTKQALNVTKTTRERRLSESTGRIRPLMVVRNIEDG